MIVDERLDTLLTVYPDEYTNLADTSDRSYFEDTITNIVIPRIITKIYIIHVEKDKPVKEKKIKKKILLVKPIYKIKPKFDLKPKVFKIKKIIK